METKWLVYLICATAFGLVTIVSGRIQRSFFLLTILALQADVGLTIGEWRPPLYVGDSGPTGFALPLIFFPAVALLLLRVVDSEPMQFGAWRVTVPAIVLAGTTVLTVFYTPERRLAIYSLQMYVYGYAVFLIALNFVKTREDVRLVLNLLMLTLVVQSLVYYAEAMLGFTFTLTGDVRVFNASGVARHGGTVSSNPKGFAMFISPLLLIAISRFLSTSCSRVKYLSLAIAGMGLVALVLNRTRAAWIGVTLGCVWIVIEGLRRRAIVWPRVAALMVAASIAVVAMLPVINARLSGDNIGDYNERATLMRQARRMIADNPILGVGAGAYGTVLRNYVLPEERRTWLFTVHNAYLLTWAETGLLGLTGLVLLFALGLRQTAVSSHRGDESIRVLALGWGAGLIHLAWELWWDLSLGGSTPWLMWFMLGVLAASARIPDAAAVPVPAVRRAWQVHREAWT